MSFAKTTNGPPAPTGVDTNKHALIADQLNGVVEMVDDSGNTHTLGTMWTILQAQTALTTITTAQTMAMIALPAQSINKKNRTFRLSGRMIFTTANAAQITIAIKLGSVTLCSIQSAATAAAITNGQLSFEFIFNVVATGASGTVESHGILNLQISGTISTAIPQYVDQNTAVSSAIDLTAAENLVVSIAAGAAVASAQVRQLLLECIG